MSIFGKPRHWGKGNKSSSSSEKVYFDYEIEEDEDDGETLSVWDAADIWASNGKDEDYTFGYSEEELEDALNS